MSPTYLGEGLPASFWRQVECSTCGAAIGQKCISVSSKRSILGSHLARREAVEARNPLGLTTEFPAVVVERRQSVWPNQEGKPMMTADPARQALIDRTSELIEGLEGGRLGLELFGRSAINPEMVITISSVVTALTGLVEQALAATQDLAQIVVDALAQP